MNDPTKPQKRKRKQINHDVETAMFGYGMFRGRQRHVPKKPDLEAYETWADGSHSVRSIHVGGLICD